MNKDIFDIKDDIAYEDFKAFLAEDKPNIIKAEGNVIETDEYIFEVSEDYLDLLELVSSEAQIFDISGYSVKVIENQGYTFKTF